MILHCPAKTCNTTREHKLKVNTNEVICMECMVINTTVTEFMKSAMKSSNDVYRAVESRQAFMFRCAKCNVDRSPKIVNDQAVCSVCTLPLKLSAPMIEAIKTTMVKNADENNTETNKGVIKRRKS
jgi:hypothetical protein